MLLPKVWLSDCVISKSTRFLCWVSLVQYVLPTKPPSQPRNHGLQCTTAGPYNAMPSSLLQVPSICGLGPDLVGLHSISLAARYRVAACSSTLRRGLAKINEAREHSCTPLFALSPARVHEFLFPSMTFHTANAFDIVCRLDRDDILDEVLQTKSKKLSAVYFWISCAHKTLLGLSPVVPHESWDQSVVIVLLTSCSTLTCSQHFVFAFSGSLLSQQVMD